VLSHSSELPRYRGIAAEFHNLLNGKKTVGLTVMRMEGNIDAGSIIGQGTIPIPAGVTLHGLIKLNYSCAYDAGIRLLLTFLYKD